MTVNYYFDPADPLKPYTHSLPANAGTLPPTNATRTPPEFMEGFRPCWNGEGWQQVEDYCGLRGWLNGAEAEIATFGPLPEGWSNEPPEPTSEELAKARIEDIRAELLKLDLASIRPLRSLMEGAATAEDQARLNSIEAKAQDLRLELKELIND